jgi:hypothetical protein
MDDNFVFQVLQKTTKEVPDPKMVKEACKQLDWPKSKIVLNFEPNFLISSKVFDLIIIVPDAIYLTGYKWTFVKKKNSKGKIIR